MHGQFNGTIEADVENSKLIVNGKEIRVTAERNPADLKWNEVGAEYVVESTGLFLTKEKAQAHIEAGAKYVVMSAPAGNDLKTIVYSVNEKTLTAEDQVISMQDLSKQNSDKNPFFPVRICVLPQVASWGKGMVATY